MPAAIFGLQVAIEAGNIGVAYSARSYVYSRSFYFESGSVGRPRGCAGAKFVNASLPGGENNMSETVSFCPQVLLRGRHRGRKKDGEIREEKIAN